MTATAARPTVASRCARAAAPARAAICASAPGSASPTIATAGVVAVHSRAFARSRLAPLGFIVAQSDINDIDRTRSNVDAAPLSRAGDSRYAAVTASAAHAAIAAIASSSSVASYCRQSRRPTRASSATASVAAVAPAPPLPPNPPMPSCPPTAAFPEIRTLEIVVVPPAT